MGFRYGSASRCAGPLASQAMKGRSRRRDLSAYPVRNARTKMMMMEKSK